MATLLDVRYWVKRTYEVRNDLIGTDRVLEGMDAALSRLSKAVRKGSLQPSAARIEIARIVGRVFALEAMLHVDVIIGVREKYPGHCRYCRAVECRCGSREQAATPPDTEVMRVNAAVREFQRMLQGIYGFRNAQAGVQAVLLHIFEEVAEVRRAILRDRRSIQEELSDVLAHTLGLATLLGVDVEAVLADRYGAGCPECEREVCECSLDT